MPYLMLILAVLLGLTSPAVGQVYQYRDRDGRLHFTNNLLQVPSEYRQQALENQQGSSPSAVLAPAPQTMPAPAPGIVQPPTERSRDCISIVSFDSQVQNRNKFHVTYAWKARVNNLCRTPLPVRVTFTFHDKEGFELARDLERATLNWHRTEEIHGSMLIPLRKAKHIEKQAINVEAR